MNSKQAKQIPLENFMNRLGYKPVKKLNASKLAYLSPFRDEKDPSFHLNPIDNTWYDHGEGEGGKIIELATRLFSCGVKEALSRIDSLYGGTTPAQLPLAPKAPAREKVSKAIEYNINEVRPLQNPALMRYLEERGINASIAKRFLQEIYYTTSKGQNYFAVALKNNSGGYEISNPYYKGTLLKKAITTIQLNENCSSILIFEGFIDFLSYITHSGEENLDRIHTVIILSTTALKEFAVEEVKKLGCERVFLLLDNDETGNKATDYFQEKLSGLQIEDKSGIYDGFNDYNDFILNKKA